MDKGTWNKYNPKSRCRYCGTVIAGIVFRVNGYIPCHKDCANQRGLKPVPDPIKKG